MNKKKNPEGDQVQEHGGLIEFINAIPTAIQGALMAVVMSLLRVYYDANETSTARALLEASICGCLTLAAASALDWIGAPQQIAVAVGGFIGFIGVSKLRAIMFAWLNRRANNGAD